MDLDFDKNHLWHPYTSINDPLPVYPVVSASGVRIKLENKQELIDGMSSWWTAIHGYNVPEINVAAETQLKKMSHVMFGGITHEPAIELGKLLVELSPKNLEKVFFSDSGSVSVEVALKMAVQYQNALNKSHKKKFLTFSKGYHGDTSGAMSVCDPVSGMHQIFADFMPEHYFVEEPANGFEKSINLEYQNKLKTFFEAHAEDSAAFILEPIVQGAGGMRIYSPECLIEVSQLCRNYGLLLIVDEIATGFGRTGKMFAIEHAGIEADIMCVGKAMTGGYVSMAATLCSKEVADTISSGEAGVMMHGPTFMANPLACAISVASLNLLLKSEWKDNVLKIENILNKSLKDLMRHSKVQDVRVLGAIGVVQTVEPVNVAIAQRFFVDKGVWIRPFRNLIYIMPSYIMKEEDLLLICSAMREVLDVEEVFINNFYGK